MTNAAVTTVISTEEPRIPQDLILVSEAAERAKKSLGWLYLHIREGKLRGFKSGRYTYVPKSEVDALLEPRPLEFVPYESKPRRKPAARVASAGASKKVAKKKAR